MKNSILFLAVLLGSFANAGEVRVGNEVDLTCTYKGGNTAENSIELTIKEKGLIARQDIPAHVPDVFMDEIIEGKYLMREFVWSAKIKLSEGNAVYFDTQLRNKSFYGGLSFPDIADGFKETNAYGSYAESENFRAFIIEQERPSDPLKFRLYWQRGFATNSPLDCEGTIPSSEIARPGVVHAEPYHRHFVCKLAASRIIPAIDFELKVKNLQNERLMEPVEFRDSGRKTGWFVHGEDMDQHLLGKINEADAQILNKVNRSNANPRTRLVSKYYDECGSFNCFSVELDLAFPEKTDLQIRGSFRKYEDQRGSDRPVLKGRSDVTCDLR